MVTRTDDLRIRQVRTLLTPGALMQELPLPESSAELVHESRRTIEAIMNGAEHRLLVVVGPCSIHDSAAAVEYVTRLKTAAQEFAESLFLVSRVYFEKPRTIVGWKGLINDPDLDGTFRINKGLRLARKLLLDVAALGMPAGTEFLDTTFGQFYADLVSWGAIGARTTESQVHRELASGLSMPVGFKNRTDGDVQVAVDAIRAASVPHWFPSLTKEGAPALLETSGNDRCHVVLRGGTLTGPNYAPERVKLAAAALAEAGLPQAIMIDCSHGNSERDPQRQPLVAESVAQQIEAGEQTIRGVMLESNLVGGRQDHEPRKALVYGQSITDACLSFADTVPVLERLARAMRSGARDRKN